VFEHCLSHSCHSFIVLLNHVLFIGGLHLFMLVLYPYSSHLPQYCHPDSNFNFTIQYSLVWPLNPSSNPVFSWASRPLLCCADWGSLMIYSHSWMSVSMTKTRILMSCYCLELCLIKNSHQLTLVNKYRLSFWHFCAGTPFSNDTGSQLFGSFSPTKKSEMIMGLR
jgi:hypothetical protein